MDGDRRRNLKEWAVALFIPMMFLAAWGSVTAVGRQSDQNRLEAVCAVEHSNIIILNRINKLSDAIGVPTAEVPEVSAPCAKLQPSPSP